MPLVSATLMEQTWRAVGASSDAAVQRMQKQCGKDQEELTAFVLAFTSDLRPEALGLALYVHLVATEAFRRSGAKFRRLKAGPIEQTWKENFGFINDLKAAGHTCSHFSLSPELTSEPSVVQYVIDALTEQDNDDPVVLSDAEFWHILQILKTVADCMHDAALGKNAA